MKFSISGLFNFNLIKGLSILLILFSSKHLIASTKNCNKLFFSTELNSELNMNAQLIIEKLNLKPLPGEGGFFNETYRSKTQLSVPLIGKDGVYDRTASTAIYYLVTPESFSALHKVSQDEIFHFYGGDPSEMFVIHPDGTSELITLGSDILNNEHPQVIVPAGSWQGTKIKKIKLGWSLMGTTVAPGFEFDDYYVGGREELVQKHPSLKKLIFEYTK